MDRKSCFLSFCLQLGAMGLTLAGTLPSLAYGDTSIPCRSGYKSDTAQLEMDKDTCRDLCPNEICGGRPAIMNTTIFADADQYQIDCKCLAPNSTSGGSGSIRSGAANEASAGTCSFLENRNGAFVSGAEAVYGSSRQEITQNCQWLCRDGIRKRNCEVTEWF